MEPPLESGNDLRFLLQVNAKPGGAAAQSPILEGEQVDNRPMRSSCLPHGDIGSISVRAVLTKRGRHQPQDGRVIKEIQGRNKGVSKG